MLFKNVFYYRKIKGKFCAQKSKEIALLMKKHSLMHYEGRPRNYLFQLFLKL